MSFSAPTSPREPSEFFGWVLCSSNTELHVFLGYTQLLSILLLMSSLSVQLRLCPPPQQSLLPVFQNHLRCHLLQEVFLNTLKSMLYIVDYKIQTYSVLCPVGHKFLLKSANSLLISIHSARCFQKTLNLSLHSKMWQKYASCGFHPPPKYLSSEIWESFHHSFFHHSSNLSFPSTPQPQPPTNLDIYRLKEQTL